MITTQLVAMEGCQSQSLAAPHHDEWPLVSVIVPCRNEEKHIARCLDSVLASDYPKDRLEIVVVDGMSDDRTREIVKRYAGEHGCVRLVDNLKRGVPEAFNLGIRHAVGDTIMLMSAHSTCKADYIRLCVQHQAESGAENVGGICKIAPGADTSVARAITLALGHRFGSGNAMVKVGASKPTWSDSAAFGCYKKALFDRIGFFDERLKSSSDLDLNVRIKAAGGRILLVPQIVVSYTADDTWRKFRAHNFADGVWISYVLKYGRNAFSWRHWIPAAFVFSLVSSFALALIRPFFLWMGLGISALYLIASLTASTQIAIREKSLRQFLLLPIAFATRHIPHGLGALLGLVLVVIPGEHWKGRRGRTA